MGTFVVTVCCNLRGTNYTLNPTYWLLIHRVNLNYVRVIYGHDTISRVVWHEVVLCKVNS